MHVTPAVTRDQKQPPPIPPTRPPLLTSAEPPPLLPSMLVPRGTLSHEAGATDGLVVQAAVLEARRASEELEWQAQVASTKNALAQSEAAEWDALRARRAATPLVTSSRAPTRPPKPTMAAARATKAPATPASADHAERQAEEREWQALRAAARQAEELEWDALLTRARAADSQPEPSVHDGGRSPFDLALMPGTMRLERPAFTGGAVVAWP